MGSLIENAGSTSSLNYSQSKLQGLMSPSREYRLNEMIKSLTDADNLSGQDLAAHLKTYIDERICQTKNA
jgi:hypothetical protein